MNSRASRNQRLRKRAWALVAALLTTADCLAMAGEDAQPTHPAPGSATEPSGTGRLRIPPPRQFKAEELQARAQGEKPTSSRIPPPRRFAIGAANRKPAAELAPAPRPAAESIVVDQPRSETPNPREVQAPTASPVAEPSRIEASAPALIEAPAPLDPPAALSVPAAVTTEPAHVAEPPIQVSAVPVEPVAPAAPSPGDQKEARFAPLSTGSSPASFHDAAAKPAPEPAAEAMPPAVKQALEVLSAPASNQPAAETEPAVIAKSQELRPETRPHAPEIGETTSPPEAAATPVTNPFPAVLAPSHTDLEAPAPPMSNPPAAEPAPAPATAPVPSAATPAADPAQAKAATRDDLAERTACTSCGGFHSSLDGPGLQGCLTCGGGGQNCVPGQKPCYPPESDCDSIVGAFCQRLYECLCCPDPCYQPAWVPAANASFFADYARPRTVTRLRYDNLEAMTRPDRNQFWINQVRLNSFAQKRSKANLNRPFFDPSARLQQVYLYQEAAGERGSFFVETPYRQINSNWEPTQAGFGDINFGVKSLLFDCEMLQVSFQMRTYMPSGNFQNNLGTGQFAVDPSILASLKLGPDTYFQTQLGNWVPLGGPGGNSKLAGGIFYWFMSLNQVLWYTTPDSPLIATLEMDGWSFENGGYTTHIPRGQAKAQGIGQGIATDGGGVSYFNIGPGLRQSICNRVDFGGAITWATNTAHWAQPWFRFEVRFLF